MKFLIILVSIFLFADKPKLFLLDKYSEDINVTSWYMSEKLDGVRAYWDGKHLISRGGNKFKVPSFFTKDFPDFELDGELWSKRADFDKISSIVRTVIPNSDWESKWSKLTYNIFEVPNANGNLIKRLSNIKESNYLKLLNQIKIKNKTDLNIYLKEVEEKGGEGVVVRDGSLPYYTGRNKNALKVKSYQDAECIVMNYNEGKGKYTNKLGSLNCKLKSGKIIKIGSGFSDVLRTTPPKINSIITFKYYGLTSKGNPRFPVFMRER